MTYLGDSLRTHGEDPQWPKRVLRWTLSGGMLSATIESSRGHIYAKLGLREYVNGEWRERDAEFSGNKQDMLKHARDLAELSQALTAAAEASERE